MLRLGRVTGRLLQNQTPLLCPVSKSPGHATVALSFLSTKSSQGNNNSRNSVKSGGSGNAGSGAQATAKSTPLSAAPKPAPSTTTTILLRELGPDVTESTLKDTLKDCKYRKLELEPGCVIHVVSPAEAHFAADKIKGKFGFETKVSNTVMPALLLQNIAPDVSAELLFKAFERQTPHVVYFTGGQSLQTSVPTAGDALKAAKLIKGANIQGASLSMNKLPNGSFSLQMTNIPPTANVQDVKSTVSDAIRGAFPNATVNNYNGSHQCVHIRFQNSPNATAELPKLVESLTKSLGSAYKVSTPQTLKKPALFIRKIRHAGDATISRLLEGRPGLVRLQWQRRSQDVEPDIVVAYFSSEEAAFETLSKLRDVSVEGKKLSVTYREVGEPAIKVGNIPADHQSIEKVSNLFSFYKPARVEMLKSGEAIVVLNSPNDVELACAAMNNRKVGGSGDRQLSVTSHELYDLGIQVSANNAEASSSVPLINIDAVKAALESDSVTQGNETSLKPLSMAMNTNISAFIGFATTEEAINAQRNFVDGKISLSVNGAKNAKTNAGGNESMGLLTSSSISVLPSYVVEVSGLPVDQPAKVVESTATEDGFVNVLRTSRSAIMKFKRHAEIVPGLKVLKKIANQGPVSFVASRYRGYASGDMGEYDDEGPNEEIDRFSLRGVMKDFMFADPATRFQIAKNTFERALADANAVQDIAHLLDSTSTTKKARDEAKELLKTYHKDPVAQKSLFELFLQRDDMAAFTADFKDMEAFFGVANEDDPFDWSQFRLEVEEDVHRLQSDIAALEASKNAASKMFAKKEQGSGSASAGGKKDTQDEEEDQMKAIIKTDDGEEVEVKVDDPTMLKDKYGRLWAGAILNTDMVQKTMPGNRVNSHRALVVVGNLRGAGGFGMGKGKSSADAINAAFRDALRHLIHIDLYDNFGLAHDMHGKHNSCHAYIKATPKSREMVASEFASQILTKFGISSASVKLVGRRDPYAMVRAIFNALEQHENIDEFAKERGKRFLTLKFAYEKNI